MKPDELPGEWREVAKAFRCGMGANERSRCLGQCADELEAALKEQDDIIRGLLLAIENDGVIIKFNNLLSEVALVNARRRAQEYLDKPTGTNEVL